MFSTFRQFIFASSVILALVHASMGAKDSSIKITPTANTSTSTTLTTSTQSTYPPRGLLDNLYSMEVTEDVYQSHMSKHAVRADSDQPAHSLSNPQPLPSGVLALIRSIESVYRSLLFSPGIPERDGEITNSIGPSKTPSYYVGLLPLPTYTSIGPIASIDTALPMPPPSVLSGPGYIPPTTTSDAPQLHVAITLVWIIVITFIVLVTLSSACGGPTNGITVCLICGVIATIIVGAEAHPHLPLHPPGRAIGGLRPGPFGKIPCGDVKDTIGTKGGHFLEGSHRKIGGLKPGVGELICDNWANAHFERGLTSIPTSPSDETEVRTTTIYNTTVPTIWVTVPDTAMHISATTYRSILFTSSFSRPEPAPSSAITPTSTAEQSPSTLSPSKLPFIQESSAVPPAVNILTSVSYLPLLYLFGIVLCLPLSGPTSAFGFLLISFVLAAIIAGAEAGAVPNPGEIEGSLRLPAGVVRIDGGDVKGLNRTQTKVGSLRGAGLKKLCDEVICHSWSNSNRELATLLTEKPSLIYTDHVKRMSTVYITVPPTSGIIEIIGPNIIPVTVDSTIYGGVIQTTVDVLTVQKTSTKVARVPTTEFISPGSNTTLSSRMNSLDMIQRKTVTSGETITTVSPDPPPATSESPLPSSTMFVTTTYTLPSSSSASSPSSTVMPGPMTQPTDSAASSIIGPNRVYLSFRETNLYCFLFLFVCLNVAFTTSSLLCFLGSIVLLMVTIAVVLEMCGAGYGVLRDNGAL